MDQGREARRGTTKVHASKQIPRSPGKLVLPTGLDLVEHLRQEVDELAVLGWQWRVAVAEVVAAHAVWVCQLHLSWCHRGLWCAAAGPRQSAASSWPGERQRHGRSPATGNRTETCLNTPEEWAAPGHCSGQLLLHRRALLLPYTPTFSLKAFPKALLGLKFQFKKKKKGVTWQHLLG